MGIAAPVVPRWVCRGEVRRVRVRDCGRSGGGGWEGGLVLVLVEEEGRRGGRAAVPGVMRLRWR